MGIFLYILNLTLLLLHEMESAYEKEWEILKLPGKLTGFLLVHIPIIFIFLYGLIEVYEQTRGGYVIAILSGIGGIIPFLVHKVFVKKEGVFDKTISNLIIYSNTITGLCVIAFFVFELLR